MEHIIKVFLSAVLGFLVGAGIWYLAFWFVSGESNMFAWTPIYKLLYLILAFAASSGFTKAFLEDK